MADSPGPAAEAERWKRIQSLFHAAAELPEAAREEFLRAECGGDHALRERVRAMLAADSGGGTLLDGGLAAAAGGVLGAEEADLPRQAFGPYRITGRLGEGGMGVVYRAHRDDIAGDAAVKVLRDAAISPARRERFLFEQRALAQLNHPSIARIYDAGTLPDGTPWFAMELVDGLPIAEYCRARSLPVEARLRLFREACEAVRHAHAHAIIHRDLKPSNILVGLDARVKLLDFGIAKSLESLSDPADATRTGMRLMTPAYAAPEQVLGGPLGVHTDIYALGVVLYELLSGKLPFDLVGKSPSEAAHIVSEQAPPRPSTAAGATRPLDGTGRAAWNDLDVLCLKAMHREAARRYGTVDALLRDVDRFLAGEPLEARGDSFRYRAGKFVRRHAAAVVAGSVVFALLVGVVTFYTLRLKASRDEARAEVARTQRVLGYITQVFRGGQGESAPAETLRVVDVLDRGAEDVHRLAALPDVQAEIERTIGSIFRELGSLDRADSLLSSAQARIRGLPHAADADIVRLHMELAMLRYSQGRFDEADSLARLAAAHAERHLAPADPLRVQASEHLGSVLEYTGKYEEALPLLEAAVRRHSASGRQTPELGNAVTELANTYSYLGRSREADSLFPIALDISRRVYGERHPNYATDLMNLGIRDIQLGRHARAEQRLREALGIMRGWFGENHAKTAACLLYISRSLLHQGRHGEAAPLARAGVAIIERVHGPSHSKTAEALNELAGVMRDFERYEEAEAYYSRALEIYRARYGNRHAAVGVMHANLGAVHLDRGEPRRAEAEFRSGLAAYEGVLPPNHVEVGTTRIKLGRSLLRQKRHEEAARETRAGYDILVAQVDPGSSFLRAARKDLIADYEALGRSEEAARFRAELADTTARP